MAMIYVSFQKCFNKFCQNYLKKSVQDVKVLKHGVKLEQKKRRMRTGDGKIPHCLSFGSVICVWFRGESG